MKAMQAWNDPGSVDPRFRRLGQIKGRIDNAIRDQAVFLTGMQSGDDFIVGAAAGASCAGILAPFCAPLAGLVYSGTFGPLVDRSIADFYFNRFHRGKFGNYGQKRKSCREK